MTATFHGIKNKISNLTLKGKISGDVDEIDKLLNVHERNVNETNHWHKSEAIIKWDDPTYVKETRIVFDSDLKRLEKNMVNRYLIKPYNRKLPGQLVRDFDIKAYIKSEIIINAWLDYALTPNAVQ